MTVKWPFERCTHLLFGRGRRAAATARSVPRLPPHRNGRGPHTISSVGGMVNHGSDAAASLLSGTSSQSPVERAVIDLTRGGSGNTPESGNRSGDSFVGDFDGQTDLITMNAKSNALTMISGYDGPNPVTTTIPSGGVDPSLAFTFHTDNGFDNLAVGNTGNGVLAIFQAPPMAWCFSPRWPCASYGTLRRSSSSERADSLWFYVVPKSDFAASWRPEPDGIGGFFSNHLTTGIILGIALVQRCRSARAAARKLSRPDRHAAALVDE